jgi:hypothetical protein
MYISADFVEEKSFEFYSLLILYRIGQITIKTLFYRAK